jgi:hypothetical protein
MKQNPIIFNSEMVKAILDGRKTQVRRPFPVWQRPNKTADGFTAIAQRDFRYGFAFSEKTEKEVIACFTSNLCPIAKIGEQLWVRESLTKENWPDLHYVCGGLTAGTGDEDYHYKGDDYKGIIPAQHMPKWASRILLEVTNITVEKAYEATTSDYKAEGYPLSREIDGGNIDPFLWFRDVWTSAYGDVDQWAWVIEFKVVSIMK